MGLCLEAGAQAGALGGGGVLRVRVTRGCRESGGCLLGVEAQDPRIPINVGKPMTTGRELDEPPDVLGQGVDRDSLLRDLVSHAGACCWKLKGEASGVDAAYDAADGCLQTQRERATVTGAQAGTGVNVAAAIDFDRAANLRSRATSDAAPQPAHVALRAIHLDLDQIPPAARGVTTITPALPVFEGC
jgi:hypothetical protein